ncbi:hypothetical protein GGF46_004131 [Coemansia sp. RSA 552]|nr:hypothetical protein GGF46_004131 [Coemansia sp. RSA 552]
MFGGDRADDFGDGNILNGPQPSQYRPQRHASGSNWALRSTALLGTEEAVSRSGSSPAGPAYQPQPGGAMPYGGVSGPQPYAPPAGVYTSGPSARPPVSAAAPQGSMAPDNASGPQIYGPHQDPYFGAPMQQSAMQQSSYHQQVQEESGGSRVSKKGKLALGALAAGALAYNVHKVKSSSDEEKKEQQRKRQQEEEERIRREHEARRRREEEEAQRREEHERWRRDEDERWRRDEGERQRQQMLAQQMVAQQTGAPMVSTPAVPAPLNAAQQQQHSSAPSISSHHSGGSGSDMFLPPAPFGRAPYTFLQSDVRYPDPSRSSENSQTAETYPELWQSPGNTSIKIGTMLALKHCASGRHLRSDRSHSTESGSNQQLAYAHGWAANEDDWWQVLPANEDTPAPGSIVSYGTQIRLRHHQTGRHLHSHYGFVEPVSLQNEVTAHGSQKTSDENDHWVVERWGDGHYGHTWKSTDTVILRHYVSGMVLHTHDIGDSPSVQSVACTGRGHSENDMWKVVLGC